MITTARMTERDRTKLAVNKHVQAERDRIARYLDRIAKEMRSDGDVVDAQQWEEAAKAVREGIE